MALTKKQISQLKEQLFIQVKELPEEQRINAEKQIEEMSDEAIEQMLQQQKASQNPIFREIVSGKIPSKKIDENNEAIAVLDIKPISKGHTVIIPKDKIIEQDKISKEILNLAEKIAKNIKEKLKVKRTKIETETKFGEVIINIIPIYDEELFLDSPRTSPSEEQLDKIAGEIKEKEEIKKEEVKEEEIPPKKLPRRIP